MSVTSLDELAYPTPELVECPYPFYETLRREAPVYRLPQGPYVVTRWDDVTRIATDTETFSNAVGGFNPGVAGGTSMVGSSDADAKFSPFPLPFSDPPEHRDKRALCLDLVRRERLQQFEPVIRELANELIDGFQPRGEAEFVSEFAS